MSVVWENSKMKLIILKVFVTLPAVLEQYSLVTRQDVQYFEISN